MCSTREAEKDERESRSVALEKAYVHDVYDQLSHHFSEDRYRPWPRVRNFLQQLEPGSLVCDAGKINHSRTKIINQCHAILNVISLL